MAFQDPDEKTNGGNISPDMVGTVKDVHIDQNNPMLSSITVQASPEDNLGKYDGNYTLRMDDSKSVGERMHFAQVAKNEGGGFCGAIINDASARMRGRKVHFEGINLTGEGEATTSWIKSYRHDRLRRPGVIHTTEEPIRGQNNTDTGAKAAKIFAMSVINPEAFDLRDKERLKVLTTHADANAKRATTPKDMMYKDRNVLRNSMPITEATFAVYDNKAGEILEHTRTFDKKTPSTPQSEAYPEHYSDSERVNSFTGRPVKLPRNGDDFERLSANFESYVEQNYPDQDVTPLCIESTRLVASTKIQQNPDMFYPVDVPDGKYPSPLQQLHQANKTTFRAEAGNDKAQSRGVFHPDMRIKFAANVGQTHSRYATVDFNHLPDEQLNKHWIASCTFKGKELKPCEAIRYPVSGAVPTREAINASMNAPVGGGAPQKAQQAPQQPPEQSAPQQPAQQQQAPQQNQQAQQAQTPSQPPADPAFDTNEALDQGAEAHNASIEDYENGNGYTPNTETANHGQPPEQEQPARQQPAAPQGNEQAQPDAHASAPQQPAAQDQGQSQQAEPESNAAPEPDTENPDPDADLAPMPNPFG